MERCAWRGAETPDYDSEDDISWKSSDDDQDDEKAQDDEDADKNDLTTHDDDIIHEEETDEDDSFDPTIHTPSRISSSDDEDSDNEVEGTNVEGAKSDEDATYEEDQGNKAVEDTNTNLDGRDDVMTDVILPQVQATQEIEDTHVTLTPVNPDGQQQSSSVSSGFISNMLNPNQDTGVDDIFGQHTEATSLIDTPVTAIMEPSFTTQTNRPPTPNPQDNFSELRQTNQYAKAPSSIPASIREESNTVNQQFLDSIDEGMKKIIKEQVQKGKSQNYAKKREVSRIDQLESEVWSDIQRQLYKALVDAYEADKILLDTYGDTGISHWGKKRRQFYAFAISRESARDVYSKRRIIAVTKVEIVEWQNYKHLDWITVRRDDDVLYKFKEGDFHRLRIQDIEDMLSLLPSRAKEK
ncbi:hypothetical protein Tco_1548699 [Tanacetum coccineum]